jgi:uncharacterized protein with ATP-grasp and redox domains
MAVRVPAIIDGVIERNPDYPAEVRTALGTLRTGLADNHPLPELDPDAPQREFWRGSLALRKGQHWLDTDWFFAETYAYRKLIEGVRFFHTGRDPFLPNKREEYASPAYARAFEQALSISGGSAPSTTASHLEELFGAALFGNRIDLSFAASLAHGTHATGEDLLVDDRALAAHTALHKRGPFHIVADNAGTELTLDLVLADFALQALGVPVVLHVKAHPTFVSDATSADVKWLLGLEVSPIVLGARAEARTEMNADAAALIARLRDALGTGQLEIAAHSYWNGPDSLWDLPPDLEQRFSGAGLVVLKGDANYRRAVGDALWPPEQPFADVTAYFPAPLLALRTLKSDPIVGLPSGQAQRLDAIDPSWRVNGKRGVASLGGQHARSG